LAIVKKSDTDQPINTFEQGCGAASGALQPETKSKDVAVQTEVLQNRTETAFRRVFDMHEMLPEGDMFDRIARRYGFSEDELHDLARGDKTVSPQAAGSTKRGLFEDSTATFLDASPEDKAAAERYLYFECHTAAFEAVGHRGHAESLTYPIDQRDGDAFVTADKQFGQIYLMDMARGDLPEWRARLSFIEWFNNESIAELTRRGELAQYVVAEFTLFPYHADKKQAEEAGYNSETYKSFIRTSQVNDAVTERTIETLSYTDMLPEDIQLLREYFGMPRLESHADAETVLRQPLLISKEWYEQHGGIGGLAQLVDAIKQQRDGQHYR
jgi:uncharacterized protein Veg